MSNTENNSSLIEFLKNSGVSAEAIERIAAQSIKIMTPAAELGMRTTGQRLLSKENNVISANKAENKQMVTR